tara:strand:+ start:4025 stop:4414 length:390 start_codon:yes stop_codon:yes gene_type:complete
MGDMVFEGTVTAGLGKGAVFMSIDYYKGKIKEKLGFDPYTGTLNLKIEKGRISLLNDLEPIRIEGIKKDNKDFGGASCYKVKINDVNAAIIIPDLTEHEEDMIEIIAPINLKSKLNIKDNDRVKIELVK